jgi:hypothetical protein
VDFPGCGFPAKRPGCGYGLGRDNELIKYYPAVVISAEAVVIAGLSPGSDGTLRMRDHARVVPASQATVRPAGRCSDW